MSFEFDDLTIWERQLLDVIREKAPKELRKTTRKAGNLLRKNVRRKTQKESGELRKSYRVKIPQRFIQTSFTLKWWKKVTPLL